MPLVPFSKENIYSASSIEAAAAAEAATSWSSKGKEKSKWLRIVDVTLKDEEEEEEDQGTSIGCAHDGDFSNDGKGCFTWNDGEW